ncbi:MULTISPECIES: cytochrome c maturation protein CcmE [unclassified Lentilitoribacter]|jgi:cytochrome c-type biogenesis protein CcmE|uniref:cytochrome c maturation protein CcmE n=1 Tax=unclassified Lentilitoribacter TaxID=2647570 RepID=UPI0013A6E679|nr:cytochrome c maturation protein CcmE [Lentilitoribacter sp. Alg239-R112]
MTRKQKRLAIIGTGMGFIALAVALVMFALSSEITYFHSPTDVVEKSVKPGTRIRLGGLVEDGSIIRGEGTKVAFTITDNAEVMVVNYDGILPDLFREGQGVITEGAFESVGGPFVADTVLAKHDENYMPKEIADTLKERGVWKEGENGKEASE